jgi:hypothetical protein
MDGDDYIVRVSKGDMDFACGLHSLSPPCWTDQWPQEDGWYWIIGHPWSAPRDPDQPERLYTMEVRSNQHSRFYVVAGNFAYPGSAGPCRFQRIPNPV